jgi:hypothetical protein
MEAIKANLLSHQIGSFSQRSRYWSRFVTPAGGDADSPHEFGQLAVGHGVALAIAVLEVHPLAHPMIDPVEMSRMNRQATLVRLARVRQDSQ